MKKHLIFIGAPGSGKGTQASLLVKSHGFNHVSTGDLLRSEIAKKSQLGLEVKTVMDKGELVSDELVLKLLEKNIDTEKSFYIFDGYPRNIVQAIALGLRVLKKSDYRTIYFEINTQKLITRLTNRRTCKDCGAIYNLLTQPTKVVGVCDKCNSKNIIHRDDDKEDVIKNRMSVFEQSVQPILDYYEKENKLIRLSAEKTVDELHREINKIIN